MNQNISNLSEYEFERLLTPERVKVVQVIQGTFILGIILFAAVVILSYIKSNSSMSADLESLNLLSIVHGVFVLNAIAVSHILFKRMLSGPEHFKTFGEENNVYEKSLLTIRVAMLIRMAVLEGGAFFGLVVTLIAVKGGAVHRQPAYLLNMISAAITVAIGLVTFPTKERLKDIFRRHIKKSS